MWTSQSMSTDASLVTLGTAPGAGSRYVLRIVRKARLRKRRFRFEVMKKFDGRQCPPPPHSPHVLAVVPSRRARAFAAAGATRSPRGTAARTREHMRPALNAPPPG